MSDLVFETIHGSRLYGFASNSSDYDYYRVTTGTADKASHRMHLLPDGTTEDVVTVGFDRFLELAKSGSHQAVEALFSTKKRHGSAWAQYGPVLNGMRIGGPEVLDKYARTIKAFSFGEFKKRRHAVRLKHGYTFLRAYGALNPTLSTQHVEWCNNLAEKYEGKELLGMLGFNQED